MWYDNHGLYMMCVPGQKLICNCHSTNMHFAGKIGSLYFSFEPGGHERTSCLLRNFRGTRSIDQASWILL